MKISVIISTLGRKKELEDLLMSIDEINNYSHEIIIIDQNFSFLIDDLIVKFSKKFNIIQHKVDFRSLSKAKNFGIQMAKGELICFPDDDSTFLRETIETGISFLDNHSNKDVVFGKCIDQEGNDSVIKFETQSGDLDILNFEGKFIEATMFARTEILKKNLFDENLGIGAFFGAEEGYDLVYRLLKLKHNISFNTNILFYHPQSILEYDSISALKRVFNYRLGFAYVCMKHSLYFKYFKRLFFVLALIPISFFIRRNRFKFYSIEFLSLIIGVFFAKQTLK
jgi:glycosyltransferase involved in cell wall biosynthesis